MRRFSRVTESSWLSRPEQSPNAPRSPVGLVSVRRMRTNPRISSTRQGLMRSPRRTFVTLKGSLHRRYDRCLGLREVGEQMILHVKKARKRCQQIPLQERRQHLRPPRHRIWHEPPRSDLSPPGTSREWHPGGAAGGEPLRPEAGLHAVRRPQTLRRQLPLRGVRGCSL